MSEQNRKARDSQPSDSSAVAASEGLQATEQGAEQVAGQAEMPDELKVLRAEVVQKAKELEQMNDQLQRACIGLRHAKQAAVRDLENARKYGIQPLASSLLPCVDSLEQRLASPPQPGDAALRKGLQRILDDPEKALDSHDIKPYHPEGEDFQPSLRQASAILPAPAGRPAPERQAVLQRGWVMGERALRCATVIVSAPPQRKVQTPKQTPKADGASKAERQHH